MEQADKNNELNNQKETNHSFFNLIFKVVLIALIIVVIVFVVRFFVLQEKYPSSSSFSKEIKVEIENAINNGAKLDVVKQIYNNREVEEPQFVKYLIYGHKNFYSEPTSLSTILSDIKVDCYRTVPIDSIFIERLGCIIIEHNEINPFDKLENNQKFLFENIRQKLNDNYSLIQDDLNRIADEMNNKNILVGDYLAKSTLSFWISIGAVGITVILGIWQIAMCYRYRPNKKNNEDDIDEDTNEDDAEDESEE